MTTLQDVLDALRGKAGPPKARDQQLIILSTVLQLDGSREDSVRPDHLDLDAVAAHPERYRLEREAILRIPAPPGYVRRPVAYSEP